MFGLFDITWSPFKETLDLVQMYAQARLQVDGDRSVVNVIAAIIPHTSREMDMQLHSHCVIMNGTHRRWQMASLWHESIVDAEAGSYYRQL